MGKSSIDPTGITTCRVCGQRVMTDKKGNLEDHSIGSGWDGDKRIKRDLCAGSGEPADE